MREGFAAAAQAHLGMMLRAAVAVTHDRELAADAVQEALFRAWRVWDRLPADARREAWLRTIARREALRVVAGRRPSVELPSNLDGDGDPADAAVARWEREVLRRAVAALPAHQREALWLRYAAERPVQSIAEAMGLPAGTVKSHLHRGRQALRAVLLHEEAVEVESAIRRLERLVRQLEAAGTVGDPAVAAALRAVPRHEFLPNVALRPGRTPTGGWWAEKDEPVDPEAAYRNALVIVRTRWDGVACPSPGWAATLLRALDVRTGHRVAEVQCGTGYVTALLCRLVGTQGQVDGHDTRAEAAWMAHEHLAKLRAQGYQVRCGAPTDGAMIGDTSHRIDRVLVTATASDVSRGWWMQLAPDALVVVPVNLTGLPVLARLAFATDADGTLSLRGRLVQRVPDAEADAWVDGVLGVLGGMGVGEWDQGMRIADRNRWFDRWEAIADLAPLDLPIHIPAEGRRPDGADGLRLFTRLIRPYSRIGAMRHGDVRLVDLDAGGDLIVDLDAGRARLRGSRAVLDDWHRVLAEWQSAGAPAIGDFHVSVAEPGAPPIPGRWQLPATWHTWTVDLSG